MHGTATIGGFIISSPLNLLRVLVDYKLPYTATDKLHFFQLTSGGLNLLKESLVLLRQSTGVISLAADTRCASLDNLPLTRATRASKYLLDMPGLVISPSNPRHGPLFTHSTL